MAEEKKAVEAGGDAAATAVETTKSTDAASETSPEIKALLERVQKAERDRDNYKEGLLRAKGKLPEGETGEPDLATIVSNTVREELSKTEYAQARKELEATLIKKDREARELRAALSAKNASTSIAGGSSSGAGVASGSEVKTEYWSPEQKEALKARGMTDDQIKRAAELAAGNMATAPLSK